MCADDRGCWLPDSVGQISDQQQALFRDRIASAVESIVGSSLVDVRYRCLKGEADSGDILFPDFFLGAEVELIFDGGIGSRFVTWDENAGWGEQFSVRVADRPLWPGSAVTVFNATEVSTWQYALGEAVERVSVLGDLFGQDLTPYVLVLYFARTTIAVGSSWRTTFGDGDDVFIDRYDPDSVSLRRLVEIWRCER